MVADQLIVRGFKPVYWSPSSQTALAESELEYMDDHKSHAAFIAFPLASSRANSVLAPFETTLSSVIWTTTPWTIPANQALCVHPSVEYVVVQSFSALSSGRCFGRDLGACANCRGAPSG